MLSNLPRCPHQSGPNHCSCGVGHEGMHHAYRELGSGITVEVFWADEWLGLSANAEVSTYGSTEPVGEA